MRITGRVLFGLAIAVALLQPAALRSGSVPKPAAGGDFFVYIGTYTGKGSEGIYLYRLDTAAGKLTALGVAAKVPSPSFLAIHPDGRHLYAVSEISNFEGKKSGAVSAYELDPHTGGLTLLNKVSSKGTGPCHVTVDRSGRDVLVANYDRGSVAVLPVKAGRQAGGSLCLHSAFGFERESAAAERAARAFHQCLARQSLCRGRRSWPGPDAGLSF